MGMNLVGQKFNRLTAVKISRKDKWRTVFYEFICDCGNKKEISGKKVKYGLTKSCGCFRKELTGNNSKIHGKTGSSEYVSWMEMRGRCNNKNKKEYKYYGKIGVRVCKRWESFESFFKDMGEKPTAKYTIDRIDPFGNYEPKNCRWATRKEQSLNQRRNKK